MLLWLESGSINTINSHSVPSPSKAATRSPPPLVLQAYFTCKHPNDHHVRSKPTTASIGHDAPHSEHEAKPLLFFNLIDSIC